MKVLDTTFLIDLFNGEEKTKKIIEKTQPFYTTQINMYEIIRGLVIRRISPIKFAKAMELFQNINVLPLTDIGIIKSAEICAELLKRGLVISDTDCLTAGIALSYGIDIIVTRDVKHFQRIPSIRVETY